MPTALLLCRLAVAGVFAAYGLVKVLGGQFTHGDFVLDSRTAEPTSLVWAFYGYSPAYGRFVGLCELGPALLLLNRRTQLLGALALFAVSLNITVMDFCFGFPPVKYFSLLLTVLCAALVAGDWRKVRLAFWDDVRPELLDRVRREATAAQPAGAPRPRRAWLWVVGALAVVPLANVVAVGVDAGPESVALAHLAAEGHNPTDLSVRSWRRTGGDFGFGMEAVVEAEVRGASVEAVRVFVSKPHGFVGWRVVGVERAGK